MFLSRNKKNNVYSPPCKPQFYHLLFVASLFILRGDLLYVLPCVILFLCFSVLLALRLPRLGEERERANLGAFRAFVRFVLVWF